MYCDLLKLNSKLSSCSSYHNIIYNIIYYGTYIYVYLDIKLKIVIINSISVCVCIKCPKIHARSNFDRKYRFIIKNCKFFIDS